MRPASSSAVATRSGSDSHTRPPPDDRVPPPRIPPDRTPSPAIPFATLALIASLGFLSFLWVTRLDAQSPSTQTSPPGSFASPSAATYPPELLAAAVAISTSLAPTPEPTLLPYRTPTPPIPTIYCGLNSALGQTCTWPQPTVMATEMPVCLTPMPQSTCIWRGNFMGTPVAIGSGVRGT